ncbi:MAG: helix-turn-helix domain-containing protein [Actinobacteria bacterium]|nr:helix-turn-helix domain-containing protein [Actinomycetota bacterium]
MVAELVAQRISELPAGMASAADPLWALNGIEARVPQGAVLYVGSVRTPSGKTLRWQYGEPASDVFDREWADLALQLTALASPVRLRILQAVLRGVTTATALVEELGAGTSGQAYHHLRELTAAGWLVSPRRGVFEMPPARVVPLLAILVAAGTPAP